ncbi:hypothetical protein PM082_015652 [Marasmius tenuissimus]|nr:hypothetical protein PM082_015652 [Marasmius tenuissimus]
MTAVGTKRKTKEESIPIGSALDDLINASSRGITCRRHVDMLYYDNNKAMKDSHSLCDPNDPQGCLRCRPRMTGLCCGLCSPGGSAHVAPVQLSKTICALSRMTVDKYEPTQKHHGLRRALQDWRKQTALASLGNLVYRTWGPQFFMADSILDRIVDCSSSRKLTSVEVLRVETCWTPTALMKHGQEILNIVLEYFPPPDPDAPVPKAPHKCSACGSEQHIKSSKSCPKRISSIENSMLGQDVPSPLTPSSTSLVTTTSNTPSRTPQPLSRSEFTFIFDSQAFELSPFVER